MNIYYINNKLKINIFNKNYYSGEKKLKLLGTYEICSPEVV